MKEIFLPEEPEVDRYKVLEVKEGEYVRVQYRKGAAPQAVIGPAQVFFTKTKTGAVNATWRLASTKVVMYSQAAKM